MRLRVGVVGLGDAWETRHRPALRALTDRYEVRAFFTDVSLLAEQASNEFEADVAFGIRALARRSDIDAILVLAPSWYGPLPILAACEQGKAIYCATALDLDPRRAADLKGRVDRSGVAFMAEFPRRQAPATLRLKELIATHLGPPKLLFCHERQRSDVPANGSSRRHSACTPTMRSMMELVDWCTYVVGREPRAVVGVNHCGLDTTDYKMISLEFEEEPDAEPNNGVAPPPTATPKARTLKAKKRTRKPAGPGSSAGGKQAQAKKDRPQTGASQPGPTEAGPIEAGAYAPRGALAQISCGDYLRMAWPEAISFRPPAALQVCCERGVAFVDLPSSLVWFDEAGRHLESLDSERPVGEQLLTQFHRAVTSLVRKTSDLEDAYRALRVMRAAEESFQEGRRIDLTR